MRVLDISRPRGRRSLVLRSFVKPFYLQHAEVLLTREAAVLHLLEGTDVPAAKLLDVDATAQHCDHPSLLMSLLPGPCASLARKPNGALTCWPGNCC